eukprot:8275555-Pyramimonas_sp.AAC.1
MSIVSSSRCAPVSALKSSRSWKKWTIVLQRLWKVSVMNQPSPDARADSAPGVYAMGEPGKKFASKAAGVGTNTPLATLNPSGNNAFPRGTSSSPSAAAAGGAGSCSSGCTFGSPGAPARSSAKSAARASGARAWNALRATCIADDGWTMPWPFCFGAPPVVAFMHSFLESSIV